jgi:hypothetical protein
MLSSTGKGSDAAVGDEVDGARGTAGVFRTCISRKTRTTGSVFGGSSAIARVARTASAMKTRWTTTLTSAPPNRRWRVAFDSGSRLNTHPPSLSVKIGRGYGSFTGGCDQVVNPP